MKIETKHQGAFCWVHPDVRLTDEEVQEHFKENPNELINVGDGRGWLGLADSKTKKINTKAKKPIKGVAQEVRKTAKKVSSSVLLLPSSGLSWQEKEDLIIEKITEKFGAVPSDVTFKELNMKSGPCETNPDGLRLLVHIKGLARQRLYDYKGRFKLNRIFNEIEKLGV